MRNDFDFLVTIVNKNIDIFLISETKIDFSFPTAQFQIEGYAAPYGLDKDMHGGNLLLYIREDILCTFYVSINFNVSIEEFFV